MGQAIFDLDDDRFPVWQQPALWTKAAAAGRILPAEDEAVRITAADRRLSVNCHQLLLGPQKLLAGRGRYVFDRVRSEFDFGAWDFWEKQRDWLLNTFRTVYPADEGAIGTLTFFSARRPSGVRHQQDPGVRVTQGAGRVHYMRREANLFRAPLPVGDLRLATRGLRFACASETARRRSRVAMMVVPRRVLSDRFGMAGSYQEFWYCLAEPGVDDQRLKRGEIPAHPAVQSRDGAAGIRYGPMLNLVRISRRLLFTWLAVEIHPESAEVISLRWGRMPLSVALLNSSPVVHARGLPGVPWALAMKRTKAAKDRDAKAARREWSPTPLMLEAVPGRELAQCRAIKRADELFYGDIRLAADAQWTALALASGRAC